MPRSAFSAIKNSLQTLLGDAEISLIEHGDDIDVPFVENDPGIIVKNIQIDGTSYSFRAQRENLAFTSMEADFVGELMLAFEGLFAGFSAKGFAGHFRTALLTSLMDIAVARYIRANRKGVFWPIQSLIQLLKNLSYQRYEGTAATTGFLIYRTQLEDFTKTLKETRYDWIDLGDNRRRINSNFFRNPLSYRFIDGSRAMFVCDINMTLKGAIGTSSPGPSENIDQLSNREKVRLLSEAGNGAFAVFVNKSSEVEVVLQNDKLLLWRKGFWCIFDPDIFREFLTKKLEKRSIDHLLWAMYALSKARHGTVILVADDHTNLDSLRMGSVGGRDPLSRALIEHVRGKKIGTLKRSGELSRILSSDGLTVINKKGELLDTGVIIDTSRVTELVTGGGRTTAATAASHFGPVIKVSEDGQIVLFRNGRKTYQFG